MNQKGASRKHYCNSLIHWMEIQWWEYIFYQVCTEITKRQTKTFVSHPVFTCGSSAALQFCPLVRFVSVEQPVKICFYSNSLESNNLEVDSPRLFQSGFWSRFSSSEVADWKIRPNRPNTTNVKAHRDIYFFVFRCIIVCIRSTVLTLGVAL